MKIDAVILDWSGTAIDYGCFAPVRAFEEAFHEFGVDPTPRETREPMGVPKRDHINAMLAMPRIKERWKEIHGHYPETEETENLYRKFEEKLFRILPEYSKPKPDTLETVKELRSRGIKIGSTTGFTSRMMEIVAPAAQEYGYAPDLWVSPDSTQNFGRPYPYMIFKNLQSLKVPSVTHVIKIGDTVEDVLEGKNAGVLTVGVTEGSSEMGLSEKEFNSLNEKDRAQNIRRVGEKFKNAGADFVIIRLKEIIPLLDQLTQID
ncbi:phosphonoacetaldehyde hydrolase [Caproicibacter sp.]|uniref:phosphonoacetaldehyde hydrolase n=1 Tax=Caproicibacter sp. TaxID=2814884 RepID=UPI003988ED20